jgi:alanine transaminase
VRDLESRIPLMFFHSISKDFTGECGWRGIYFATTIVLAEVKALPSKIVSIGLWTPSLEGQTGVDCMVTIAAAKEEGENCYHLKSVCSVMEGHVRGGMGSSFPSAR